MLLRAFVGTNAVSGGSISPGTHCKMGLTKTNTRDTGSISAIAANAALLLPARTEHTHISDITNAIYIVSHSGFSTA